MSVLLSVALRTGRALVTSRALAVQAGAVAAATVLGGIATADADDATAWAAASPILVAALWLPGFWVALRLRVAWPALGRGDEARSWVFVHGPPRALPRAGAVVGAAVALFLLQLHAGILLGIALVLLPASPQLASSMKLRPASGRPLVRAGDFEEFQLPSAAPAGRLRLEPRFYFAAAPLRLPVEVDLLAPAPSGATRSLARFRLRDFGAAAEVDVPALSGGRLRFVRRAGQGAPFSFAAGRVVLVAGPTSPLAGATVLALRHLGWAGAFLLLAFATAAFLGPRVQGFLLLSLAPLSTVAVADIAPNTASLLARGLVERPSAGWGSLVLASALLLPGLLAGRTRHTEPA